jgi:hypothetical protein
VIEATHSSFDVSKANNETCFWFLSIIIDSIFVAMKILDKKRERVRKIRDRERDDDDDDDDDDERLSMQSTILYDK